MNVTFPGLQVCQVCVTISAVLYGVSKNSVVCSVECTEMSMKCESKSLKCIKVHYEVLKDSIDCTKRRPHREEAHSAHKFSVRGCVGGRGAHTVQCLGLGVG